MSDPIFKPGLEHHFKLVMDKKKPKTSILHHLDHQLTKVRLLLNLHFVKELGAVDDHSI